MKNRIVEQSKITAQQIDKDTRGCHVGIISKESSKTEGEREKSLGLPRAEMK